MEIIGNPCLGLRQSFWVEADPTALGALSSCCKERAISPLLLGIFKSVCFALPLPVLCFPSSKILGVTKPWYQSKIQENLL